MRPITTWESLAINALNTRRDPFTATEECFRPNPSFRSRAKTCQKFHTCLSILGYIPYVRFVAPFMRFFNCLDYGETLLETDDPIEARVLRITFLAQGVRLVLEAGFPYGRLANVALDVATIGYTYFKERKSH